MSRALFAVLVGLILAWRAACAAPSAIPANDFADFAFAQNLGAKLPLDATLRGADGQPVRLGSAFGSVPVVLDFEYDRCTTLCGLMLDQLTDALGTLPLQAGRDYRVVAIDIDPEANAADAAQFAHLHGADRPGMSVLTGDDATIRRIAAAAGFPYRLDPATGQYAHPAGFVVATPDGTVSRYLLGLDWRPLDLRLAIGEAAGSRIGSPVASVLLFCYCYDPATGQYDLAAGRLMAITGIATLLALGATIWLAARRVAR